jgi:hypothetical protein
MRVVESLDYLALGRAAGGDRRRKRLGRFDLPVADSSVARTDAIVGDRRTPSFDPRSQVLAVAGN